MMMMMMDCYDLVQRGKVNDVSLSFTFTCLRHVIVSMSTGYYTFYCILQTTSIFDIYYIYLLPLLSFVQYHRSVKVCCALQLLTFNIFFYVSSAEA